MKKVLLQLDSDSQPSVFDAIVAVDSKVDHLLRHGAVIPEQVTELVHGCIFTRGGETLKNTAIFIGGSDVDAGEELLVAVNRSFFGPMRVSVMMDANGCNTTAAAAVVSAAKHIELAKANVTILAGTGAVGRRIAQLCLRQGATVKLCSRKFDRAIAVCQAINNNLAKAQKDQLTPVETSYASEAVAAASNADIVFAAGAAGVALLDEPDRKSLTQTGVIIDLNAVPPLGIGGIEVHDKAVLRDGQICYGAVGIGNLKMKIHKAAIAQLFKSQDQILNVEEIYDIGVNIGVGATNQC